MTATRANLAELIGSRLSTATVMFHAALARAMGLSVTDAKCRTLLFQLGPMTAGELARRLGLTTGAITGVIDRLERAKWVKRVADPADRRRVVVEPVSHPARDRAFATLSAPMKRRIMALVASYSARDQAVLAEFLSAAVAVLETETPRLNRSLQRNRPRAHWRSRLN